MVRLIFSNALNMLCTAVSVLYMRRKPNDCLINLKIAAHLVDFVLLSQALLEL